MAKKPNYEFEKRRKEMERKAKKEERKARKLENSAAGDEPVEADGAEGGETE